MSSRLLAEVFVCKNLVNDPLCKSKSSCKELTECYDDIEDVASLATDLDSCDESLATDLDSCDEFGDCEFESLKIHELQLAFERDMQFKIASEQVLDKDLNSTENEMLNLDSENIHEELKILEVNALSTTTKELENCKTFPCVEEKGSSSVSIGLLDIKPIFTAANSYEKQAEISCYQRANSLPSASNLISAMKGGCEKEGHPSKLKLSVKWAADVYDPPITLMSHTVKNHQQRPRPKKKERSKHSKHKSRSSRSAVDKKLVNRNIAKNKEPVYLRLQSSSDKTLLDGYTQSSYEEILDYAVGGNESKCGSSFLMGSLTKVQYSVAEAL